MQDGDEALPRHGLILGFLAVLSVVLVAMGLPRMIAGIHAGPQTQTMRDIALGQSIPDRLVNQTIAGRHAALSWHERPEWFSDLGLLFMVQARDAEGEESRALLGQAAGVQQAALHRAPRRAYDWTRLAQTLDALDRDPRLPAILERALVLAPREGQVLIARLDVALGQWHRLSADQQKAYAAQIHLAARWRPTELARIVRARFAQPQVIEVLSADPDLLRRFLYAYGRP